MRKYNIFIAALGVLTLVFLIGGFGITGSPILEQQSKLDQQRLSDFSTIKYRIEDYYRSHRVLPADLRMLTASINLSDPKTKEAYDYVAVDKTHYKLCTEFATDTTKQSANQPVTYTTTSTAHRKGYNCISYTIPSSLLLRPTPTLAVKQPSSASENCPGYWQDGECRVNSDCLDSDGINYYSRGSVTYKNPTGEGLVTVYDKCVVGSSQVTENICETGETGITGDLIWGQRIYDCPQGCSNGACIKNSVLSPVIIPQPIIE